MKKQIILIITLALPFIGFAQDFSRENPEPESFPFGEIGDTSRGVFGADDRIEATDAFGYADYVRATAVMVPKKEVSGDKIYGYSLRDRLKFIYKTDKFDENVKFLDQPTCGSCTGFLIAPDILVTAGHCIETMEKANDYVWVFDYTTDKHHNSKRKYVTIPVKDQYTVKEIITAKYGKLSNMTDYSVLRLDRKTDREPYRFRTSGKIGLFNDVYMIGSPTGLPLKMADNAYVVSNTKEKWFKNNLDGFPGNSGGPVFNKTGFIEGIHVRGAVEEKHSKLTGDYYYDKDCDCVKTVEFNSAYSTGGSQAHRITHTYSNSLDMAIYENIEYAIETKNNKRLDKWLVYQWILKHKYTEDRGRLEFVAIANNNLVALEKMLKISKDYGLADKNGKTLLHHAVDAKNADLVSYLLKNGASPNVKDGNEKSALAYAAYSGNVDAVKTMLERGGKIEFSDRNGNTVLHNAILSGNREIVRMLAMKGANFKVKNYDGKNAKKLAKKNMSKDFAKYVKKAA
ncbi:MAG: ankyrin repeat domain-containing protein, partial [Bacteroidia bacterium]